MDTEEVGTASSLQASSMIARSDLQASMDYARGFPRSISRFIKECAEIACLDSTVARECIYALPRKEDGKTKMIEGPSARLGEIVLSCWGNCAAGARVADEDREFIYAQGFFFDMERNVRITREVRRRITNRDGVRYSADMVAVTANAASSIAQRNAVFAGIPKALWWDAYLRARNVIAGTAETIEKRRSEEVDIAKKMGVPLERIFAALGVEGIRDIGVDEIVALSGLTTAIRDNEIKVDDAFPDPESEEPPTKRPAAGLAGLKDRLAGVGESSKTEPEKTETTSEGNGSSFDPPRPGCSASGCTNESEVLIEGKPYCSGCRTKAQGKAIDRAVSAVGGTKK